MKVTIRTRDKTEYEQLRQQLDEDHIDYTVQTKIDEYVGKDWIPEYNDTIYEVHFTYTGKLI